MNAYITYGAAGVVDQIYKNLDMPLISRLNRWQEKQRLLCPLLAKSRHEVNAQPKARSECIYA